MDCRPDINGQLSKDRMGNLLHDIISFKELNNEQLSFESKNSKFAHKLVKIPFCDGNNFFSKSCTSGWVEKMLEFCIENETLEDSIHHILDYLLRKHGDVAQAQLQYLAITQKL